MTVRGSSAALVRPISSARTGVGVSGSSGSMVTVHAQCGVRPAGERGGRWTGRIRSFGLVAHPVASKVGSSMWWHMATTMSSPIGSTSISAPQWSRWNVP